MPYDSNKISIPIGTIGFVHIKNQSKIPLEGAIQAEGLDFIDGSVQREAGNIVYPVTFPAGSFFLDGVEYFPTTEQRRLVTFVTDEDGLNAKLYKDTGMGTPVLIKDTLRVGIFGCKFVVCGTEVTAKPKKLAFFNGFNPVQFLTADDAATHDITKPPADWTGENQPYWGILHGNCLWAGGNKNSPHRIYKSDFADHEDFTTNAYSIDVFPGEGEGLSGGFSHNGRLFLFKRPTGIYWLDDSSINENDWGIKKLVNTLGLVNPNAICQTEEDLVFIDPTPGLYSLSSVQEFGDVKPRSLLEEYSVDNWVVENFRKNAPYGLYYAPKLLWHKGRRTLIMSFMKDINIFTRLTLDYRNRPIKIGYSYRDPQMLSVVRTNDDGDYEHVYGYEGLFLGDQINRSAATVAGGNWPSKYQIPHTNLAGGASPNLGTRINLEWLTIETTIFTDQRIMVDVYLDGNYKYTLTYDFPAALEGFILDVDRLDFGRLGSLSTYTRTKRLRGTAERFSFIFYSNNASTNFVLNDVVLWYRIGDAKLRRRP